MQVVIQVFQDVCVLFVCCFVYVFDQDFVQVVVIGFYCFVVDLLDFYQFVVYVVDESVVYVEDVGEVFGYVGVEVVVGFVQYVDEIVGYVFVVVVVGIFYYCMGIGVVYGEVFVGGFGGEQFVVGGVVQVGVVDDG